MYTDAFTYLADSCDFHSQIPFMSREGSPHLSIKKASVLTLVVLASFIV